MHKYIKINTITKMRLHLPIALLAAVWLVTPVFPWPSQHLNPPHGERTPPFNNNEPANEYSVTGSQSVNLNVNSGNNNYSTGLYIGAGSSFTINQNANGACTINLNGAFAGEGNLTLVAANGNAGYASKFVLGSQESSFSGTLSFPRRGRSPAAPFSRLREWLSPTQR